MLVRISSIPFLMTRTPRFLALIVLLLAGCAQDAPPPNAGNAWRSAVQTDSSGAIRGAFLARDADGEALEGQHFPPSLLFRCADGGAAVYVNWKTDLETDSATVHYALDEQPERTEIWLTSSDHQAAGQWADSLAGPLIHELMGHQQLRITTETVSGAQTWVFPLDSLEEASAPLREACAL